MIWKMFVNHTENVISPSALRYIVVRWGALDIEKNTDALIKGLVGSVHLFSTFNFCHNSD